MKRKDFIKTTTFSVLALGMAPLRTIADSLAVDSTAQTLPIDSFTHIRHGLLPKLILEELPVAFQVNQFTQGLNHGGNEELKVLSVVTEQENLQISKGTDCWTVLGAQGYLELSNESKTLYETEHLRVVVLSDSTVFKEPGKHYFTCYGGKATVNGKTINQEQAAAVDHGSVELKLADQTSSIIHVHIKS